MRRKGFTLIELLVVIAIIGILAAMLFPVFARARESARKTQCLSNVKNIALAVNMYLTDYDRLFPWACNKTEADYFNSFSGATWPVACNRAMKGNPYLREPVILEDYTKNREIWKCPSAKVMNGAMVIIPIGRNGYWLNAWIDGGSYVTDWHGADYPKAVLPCNWPFPSGWGGDVTNSFEQGLAAVDFRNMVGRGSSKVFMTGIGVNDGPHWTAYSAIQDAAKYVICGDTGTFAELWSARNTAFPDTFCLGLCGTDPACCGSADWVNCAWSQTCGLTYALKKKAHLDPVFQKTLTRHMGGVNLGFLDGHAKWYPYRTVLLKTAFDWSAGEMTAVPDAELFGLYHENAAQWR